MSDPIVRPARPTDVDGIRRVARRGWLAVYEDLIGRAAVERQITEWYAPDRVRATIERDDVGYFVAVEDDAVVGYATGGPGDEDDVGVLGSIYVDPDRWDGGVGSRLLARVESFLVDEGYESLRIVVLEANDVGRSFYESHEYECTETRETELAGVPVTECVYRGALP